MPRVIVPQDEVKAKLVEIDEDIRQHAWRTEQLRKERATVITSGHAYRAGDVVEIDGDEYLIETVASAVASENPSIHARKRNKGGEWSKRVTYQWLPAGRLKVITAAPDPEPVAPGAPASAGDPPPMSVAAKMRAKAVEIMREQPMMQGRNGYESGRVAAAAEIVKAGEV